MDVFLTLALRNFTAQQFSAGGSETVFILVNSVDSVDQFYVAFSASVND